MAKQALAARRRQATYARVDMVPDDDGTLLIMELELIEPSLFLDHAPAGAAFTHAVLSRRRANSHCLIAEVRFGGASASSRATSISATSAFSGHPRSRRRRFKRAQNIGSRLIDV